MKRGILVMASLGLVFSVACESNSISDKARAYEQECQTSLERARDSLKQLEKLEGNLEVSQVLEPLNDLRIIIDSTSNKASLYRSVHPDLDVQKVATWCEQETNKIATQIELSRPLYDKVKKLNVEQENRPTKYYVETLLTDFRRAGVDNDAEIRKKISKLREEITKISQQFDKNIKNDEGFIYVKKEDLKNFPIDFIESHKPGPDGNITITTNYPDYGPFMTYAKNDELRKLLYIANLKRAPENEKVLKNLLAKRQELAQLLGYITWAEYITEDKMIGNAFSAQKFIDYAVDTAQARKLIDIEMLLEYVRKDHTDAKKVQAWQKSYYFDVLKRDKYQLDSQEVRSYFSYENVKNGVFKTTSKLFNINYEKLDNKDMWHESVESYKVIDINTQKEIGRFFLDMHPRPNKYKHAAEFAIRSGVIDKQGEYIQTPVGCLVCNFPQGLMDHDNAVTFFHEFGHLLHHILGGKQHWVEQSGIATEWDFIEVPSQLLEEWAWDYNVLKDFAKNEKGESIPEDLVQKMNQANSFGKGLFVNQQMFYAALSLYYHHCFTKPQEQEHTTCTPAYIQSQDTLDALIKLQQEYSPYDYTENTHFQTSFGHLEGYSALYYTYMWSFAIVMDLFDQFKVFENIMSEQAIERAREYRIKVLEAGGSNKAQNLLEAFIPDYDINAHTAFEKWLSLK